MISKLAVIETTDRGYDLVLTMNEEFEKHHQQFIYMCNAIMGNNQFRNLFTIPTLKQSESDFLPILAIIVQNAFHATNMHRILAIKKGEYVDIVDRKSAKNYLLKVFSINIQA